MTVEAPERLVCNICGKRVKNKAGLSAHRRLLHEAAPQEIPDDIPTVSASEQKDIAALEAQLKEAIARAEKAEAEAEANSPVRDASIFLLSDRESVYERFGEQKLKDMAQKELGAVNRRRAQENLAPISFSGEELEAKLDEVIESLLNDRIAHGAKTDGPLMKTIKMVKPDGMLVQLPYENQINNLAGSLEDAIAIYRNKGYKLAVDDEGALLCPSQDCWSSAIMENGKNTYGGYCSQDHRNRTEGNSRPIDRSIYSTR